MQFICQLILVSEPKLQPSSIVTGCMLTTFILVLKLELLMLLSLQSSVGFVSSIEVPHMKCITEDDQEKTF